MRSITLTIQSDSGIHAELAGVYQRDGYMNGWPTFVLPADPVITGHSGARLLRQLDVESIDVWRQWVVTQGEMGDEVPAFATLDIGVDAVSPTSRIIRDSESGQGEIHRLSWRAFVPKCPKPMHFVMASWPPAHLEVTSPSFPLDGAIEAVNGGGGDGVEMRGRGGDVPVAEAIPMAQTVAMSMGSDSDEDDVGQMTTVSLSTHSSAV